MKISLIEDDMELCSSIQDELQKAGHVVDCCNDGETAMIHALNIEYCYDLAVIGRMLPIIDGMTIIKAMRQKDISISVIIVTGMSELNDRIEGFDNGTFYSQVFIHKLRIKIINSIKYNTKLAMLLVLPEAGSHTPLVLIASGGGSFTYPLPLTYHFPLVPGYNFGLFPHSHFPLLPHNILLPTNAVLPTLSASPGVCHKTSVHSSLSDMT